jgi:hypothetical protein
MWCDKCKADVAALASPDNGRLYCTACGSDLPRLVPAAAIVGAEASASRGKPMHDPRELLARWAREDALGSLDLHPPRVSPSAPETRTQLRFDGAHSALGPQAPFVERIAAETPTRALSPKPAVPDLPGRDIVIHAPHETGGPHFQSAPVLLADKSTRWVTLAGQLFAYFGVGGLTVGTVLVLIGYFGGPANHATTGWLVATAGQMLLFLGVVTLVSGGMEQTTQEVARRIDTLGERLVRIEQAATVGKPTGGVAESRSR